jgi:hypothetical protein
MTGAPADTLLTSPIGSVRKLAVREAAMAQQVRVTISGLFIGQQDWSTGLDFLVIGTGGVGQADLDTWLASVRTDLTTWVTATNGLGTLLSPHGTITDLRAYLRPSPGAPATVVSHIGGIGVTGTGTLQNTPQAAIVATLLSSNPSRKGRGRMYLPAWGTLPASTDAHLGTVTPLQVSTPLAAFIGHCNGHALAANAVGCATATTQDIITSVRVDNVYDTQRRRRDKVTATSTGTTII